MVADAGERLVKFGFVEGLAVLVQVSGPEGLRSGAELEADQAVHRHALLGRLHGERAMLLRRDAQGDPPLVLVK